MNITRKAAKSERLEFEIIAPYKETLNPVKKGTNLLFDFGKSLTLLKYENHGFEVLRHNEHTFNRHVTIVSMGFLLSQDKVDERQVVSKGKNIWRKAQGSVYGTHRLDFNMTKSSVFTCHHLLTETYFCALLMN